jgi:hypothetical protein
MKFIILPLFSVALTSAAPSVSALGPSDFPDIFGPVNLVRIEILPCFRVVSSHRLTKSSDCQSYFQGQWPGYSVVHQSLVITIWVHMRVTQLTKAEPHNSQNIMIQALRQRHYLANVLGKER